MTAPDQVVIDSRARAAWGAPAALPVAAVLQLLDGQALRVRTDGGLDPVVQAAQPWHRSSAADPCPVRGA